MVIINTYTVRTGNALVSKDASTGKPILYMFAFGTETQKVNMCEVNYNVLTSDDMCLRGGPFFSANYRGLPALVKGKLAFTSTIAEKPIMSPNYDEKSMCSKG
jgi:hypothetical protein